MRAFFSIQAASIALTAGLAVSEPARSETTCAEEDFPSFLTTFQNTPSEQQGRSADRLTMTTIVKSDGAAPRHDIQTQSKEELDWPILPKLTELNRQDFRLRLYQSDPSKAELTAFTEAPPEIFLIWYFEKTPCWTFVGLMDGSLGQGSPWGSGAR